MRPGEQSSGLGRTESSTRTREAFGKGESTFTFSGHVTFADGTRISFHQVGHVLFDETGVVKLEFFKEKAHCG